MVFWTLPRQTNIFMATLDVYHFQLLYPEVWDDCRSNVWTYSNYFILLTFFTSKLYYVIFPEPAILLSYQSGCCGITSSLKCRRIVICSWVPSGDYASVCTAGIRQFTLFPFLNITNVHFIHKRYYTTIYHLIVAFSHMPVPYFHTDFCSMYCIPLPVPFLGSIWRLCPGFYSWILEICVVFCDSCYQHYFVPE